MLASKSCQNVVHGIVLAAESAEASFFEGFDIQPVGSKLLSQVLSCTPWRRTAELFVIVLLNVADIALFDSCVLLRLALGRSALSQL